VPVQGWRQGLGLYPRLASAARLAEVEGGKAQRLEELVERVN